MKKFFCAMMFALILGFLAFPVQPVKADTLDERVGALAVDTALSSFVDVLPSPEQVETLGGVQSWLGKVGQQFKDAWERDNRNWQNFVDSIDGLIDDSFGSVFEVSESVVKDVRDVVYNFYNLIFGIDVEIGGYDTDDADLITTINSFNAQYIAQPRNFTVIVGNGIASGSYQRKMLTDIRNGFDNQVLCSPFNGRYKFYLNSSGSASPYVYTETVLTVLYWGSKPILKYNDNVVESFSNVSVNFVNMLASTDNVSFVPSVNNNFFNKYYFGFGNGSTVSPSRIVNNYDTVYNYVTNNYYTDAVREIKEVPKGYYTSPVDVNGNGISINGFGDITIDLPNADGFGDLFGDSDTSEVFAIENSSWVSLINMLPQSILIMLFIAVAVGCVCCVIKAVR